MRNEMRNTICVDIKLQDGAHPPVRAHNSDAGLDLRARSKCVIPARMWATFDTGVCINIPDGFFGKIESKSGLNIKHNIVSCGGVVDAGYTGSIVVKLYNFSDMDYVVEAGDKIAQLILIPFAAPDFHLVNEFPQTERGENGFGSSGR